MLWPRLARLGRPRVLIALVVAAVVAGTLVAVLPSRRPAVATSPVTTAPVTTAPVPAVAPPAQRGVRPNIMVVMLDDMRADELRFAPNARKYVRDRGLDFRNSFSPYPLCCPARASFLLGQYAHNHRVLYHDAPYGFGSLDDHLTVAGRLQQAGYRTALVGKYLNQYGLQRSRVTGRASEHYVPAGWTDWMVGLETRFPTGSPNAGGTYNYFAFTQNVNGRTVPHRGQYSSTVIGNQVRGLISRYHREDKPFFMWVTPVAPHHGAPREADDPPLQRTSKGKVYELVTAARPSWVKGRFDKRIKRALGVPERGAAEADVRDKPRNVRKWPEATAREKAGMLEVERQRAEAIFAWDHEFGRIVKRLKATGEYANTVLVFTSDNGYYQGEHRQRQGKIKAHEPVLRVPLVVAGPGIGRGDRFTPITTVDLTATVLDIAGARPLPAMDGASKYAAMTGPDQPWSTPVVTEGLLKDVVRRKGMAFPHGLTTSGIRTGRYKLIRYSSGEAELYDLMSDPNELRSVWKDPAYAGVRRELRRLWTRYRSCATDACRAALPPALVTSPAWLAWQDANAARAKRAYYGR